MDRDARKRLIEKGLVLFEGGVLAAVSAEEFFAGNTDNWSFGRHMQTTRDIPIIEYAETFRSVADRPDVQAVYVKIHELPDDDFPDERNMWPSAFVVFVITSATAKDVETWLQQLEPRYADADWQLPPDVSVPWPQPPPGMRPILVEML